MDEPKESLPRFAGHLLAASSGAATLQTIAVIAALTSRKAIDPFEVADWADTLAAAQASDENVPEGIRAQMGDQLREFAKLIRAMATAPAISGRG